VKFTPLEWEILKHRLEVPDALADCMEDGPHGRQAVHDEAEDAIAAGELTRGRFLAEQKAALSIERKFREVGIRSAFPR
jgi:hypothetical protein